MTKRFWKFVSENGCSLGYHGKIHYVPGEIIEVKSTNMDKTIQCASGIHCLNFTDQKYDMHNMIFGPKVAILEVEEEDIVYYEKNGKCRVRKAKILEIKEPEDWMKSGNENIEWWFNYCIKNREESEGLYNLIVKSRNVDCAYCYACNILHRHDEELYSIIKDSRIYCYIDCYIFKR